MPSQCPLLSLLLAAPALIKAAMLLLSLGERRKIYEMPVSKQEARQRDSQQTPRIFVTLRTLGYLLAAGKLIRRTCKG